MKKVKKIFLLLAFLPFLSKAQVKTTNSQNNYSFGLNASYNNSVLFSSLNSSDFLVAENIFSLNNISLAKSSTLLRNDFLVKNPPRMRRRFLVPGWGASITMVVVGATVAYLGAYRDRPGVATIGGLVALTGGIFIVLNLDRRFNAR